MPKHVTKILFILLYNTFYPVNPDLTLHRTIFANLLLFCWYVDEDAGADGPNGGRSVVGAWLIKGIINVAYLGNTPTPT